MRAVHNLFHVGIKTFLLLSAGLASAQTAFTPAWSSYVGGTYGVDDVYAVAADSATNSYIGGELGSGEILSVPSVGVTEPYAYVAAQDAFVAKVTASGSLAWYICLGGEGNDRINGLAVGPDDRVYAAGFSERYNSLLDQVEGTNACLWSIDRNTGENTMLVSTGAFNHASVLNAVTVDTNGYIYAAGYTSQTGLSVNVAAYTLNGTNYGAQLKGSLDACVMKVAPNGSVVWFRYLGGVNADAATACAVTPDGSLYVGGETRSPGWVSTASGTPGLSNKDGFLVKLNTNGVQSWSTFLGGGGSGSDAVAALAASPATHTLFVGGSAESSAFLSSPTNLTAHAAGADGFVLKLTDYGATFTNAWCRFIGSNADDRVTSLALLASGNVAAGGTAGPDGFLCALGGAGGVAAASSIGGANTDEVRAIAALPDAVLATGSTHSPGWISGGFEPGWNKDADFDGTNDFIEPLGFVGKWLSVPGLPPAITNGPADLTVQEGMPAAFHVTASGTEPLTYRWLRNGAPVAGLASDSYVIAAAARTNNHDTYCCVVSNLYGGATSRTATLTVISNGTLTVTLAPAAAVAQGAAWSLDGGATWLASGSATNLAAGSYAVSFTNLTGWIAPGALAAVQLLSGAATATSGVYTAILPSAARAVSGTNVTVTVRAPTNIAGWQLVETLPAGLTPTVYPGGTWNSSARTLTFTGAAATTNTLSYTVSVAASGLYTLSGTVTPQPSAVAVTVSGDTQILKANFIRKITGTNVVITVNQPSTNKVWWYVHEFHPAGLVAENITGPLNDYSDNEIFWIKKDIGTNLTYTVSGDPGTYTFTTESWGQIGTGPQEPIYGDSVLTIAGAVPAPDILSFTPAAGGGAFQLVFLSLTGQAYVIETNATLGALSWGAGLTVTGDGATTARAVPLSGPRLFYRVRVAP